MVSSLRSPVFRIAALLASLVALGCARDKDAPPLVATEFEEVAGAAEGERLLKVTVRSLFSESVDVELSPTLYEDKDAALSKASVVRRCAITEQTPSCNLVLPLEAFLDESSFSSAKDSATFWLALTRKRMFGKHAQQRATYKRGNVVYSGHKQSLNCAGTLTCSSFTTLSGAMIAFKAVSLTAPVSLSDPTGGASPSHSLAGAEAVLLLDPGKVFARAPLGLLEKADTSGLVDVPVTVLVGDATATTAQVSSRSKMFSEAVLAAFRETVAFPGYLVPPEGRSRRALLVVSDSGAKGVAVVGDSGATFDDIDTFAVMETVKTDIVNCGTYVGEKDQKKKDLSATLETTRVTVIERASGKVLGTKVLRAGGNPCQEKTTGDYGMGLVVSIDAAAEYASTL